MKNLLLLFMSIAICFASCGKEEVKERNLSLELKEKISEVTKDYIETQSEISSVRLGTWYDVVAADVQGFGGSLDNGSSLIDAAIDGGAASLKELIGGINTNPPVEYGDASFLANPYDLAGKIHVELLDFVAKETSGAFMNGNVLNYAAYIQYANSVVNGLNFPSYAGTASSQQQYVDSEAIALAQANNLLSNMVNGQSTAHLILKNYFLALENTQNAQDFVNYSKGVEMSIINSQQFTSSESEFLLSNMSTARHDVNYWGS